MQQVSPPADSPGHFLLAPPPNDVTDLTFRVWGRNWTSGRGEGKKLFQLKWLNLKFVCCFRLACFNLSEIKNRLDVWVFKTRVLLSSLVLNQPHFWCLLVKINCRSFSWSSPVAQVSCWEGTGRSCSSEVIHAETCRDSCPPTRSIPEVLLCLSRREGAAAASGRVQVWRTRSPCQGTSRFSGGNDVTLMSFGKLRFPFCSPFCLLQVRRVGPGSAQEPHLNKVKKYLHVIRLILFQILKKNFLGQKQPEIRWNLALLAASC